MNYSQESFKDSDEKRLREFEAELETLLKKYNATLEPEFSGDSQGVYDERIEVSFTDDLRDGQQFSRSTDYVRLFCE